MNTREKFEFLLQVKGAKELGKMIDQSELHIKRVAAKEREMSSYFIKEIEELYALREDCMKRTSRFKEHNYISELAH